MKTDDDAELPKWKFWCRLCGKEDKEHNIDIFSEEILFANQLALSDVIKQYFFVDITEQDDFSQMLCVECFSLSSTVVEFVERVNRTQDMFAFLQSGIVLDDIDLNNLRTQYLIAEKYENLSLNNYNTSFTQLSNNLNASNCNKCSIDTDKEHINDEIGPLVDIKANQIVKSSNEECIDIRFDSLKVEDDQFNNIEDHSLEITNEDFISEKNISIYYSENNSSEDENMNFESNSRENPSTKCEICDKNFTTKFIMRNHVATVHHGNKRFICEKCGAAFKAHSVLKEHLLGHSEERPFKCSKCQKGFKNKMQLKIHMDVHDTCKFICSQCGLLLNSRKTLNRHLNIHSDEMKYKCDHCGRTFKRGSTLKNHLIMHSGLRPYACNFCDKKFTFGSSCRAHKKRVHPVELAALEASGKTIKTLTQSLPSLHDLKSYTTGSFLDANVEP